jgi:hypothetical protein
VLDGIQVRLEMYVRISEFRCEPGRTARAVRSVSIASADRWLSFSSV